MTKETRKANLKASEEQMAHIIEILRKNAIASTCLDFDYETDCDYKIYIDGDISFDQMEEIVNYLKEKNV